MFVVLEYTNGKFVQAHDRNKTYKTIDGAIHNGIVTISDRLKAPQITIHRQTDNGAAIIYRGRMFVIINVLDFAIERAGDLLM